MPGPETSSPSDRPEGAVTQIRDSPEPVLDVAGADAAIDLRAATGVAPAVEAVDAGPGTWSSEEARRVARRWQLLVALAILNALDLVTTRIVLEAGGAEANPIMAPIIHHPVAPVLVKSAGLVAVALILRACPPRAGLVDRALAAVTGAYGVIVAWNLLNIA